MFNILRLLERWGYSKRQILGAYSKICLGKKMSSDYDNIPDSLSCAVAVNNVVRNATGKPLGGGASTYLMYRALRNSPRWRKIKIWEAEAGDIIISPTGHRIAWSEMNNGHVGIVGDSLGTGEYPKKIMANSSATGLWSEDYTLGSFYERYARKGRYPVFIYRLIF